MTSRPLFFVSLVPLTIIALFFFNVKKEYAASVMRTRKPPYTLAPERLVYSPPIKQLIRGEPFDDVNKSLVEGLLPEPIKLTEENLNDFIFVSAVSSYYYRRIMSLVERLQIFLPEVKLVVYDLGVTKQQLKMMQQWCNVEVRKFVFNQYPPHVRRLKSYAFKPIIVTEVLRTYNVSGIFWVDSSVRLNTGRLESLTNIANRNQGICAFAGTGHSVYAVTPLKMLRFLPMAKDAKKSECLMATLILLYKTKFVVDHILKWWLACALSRSCIYSLTNFDCDFRDDRYNRFAHCSRFDQSALSILLYNAYNDSNKILGPTIDRKFSIINFEKYGGGGKVRDCKKHTN